MLVPIVYGIWISTAGYVIPYNSMSPLFRLFFWTNPLQVHWLAGGEVRTAQSGFRV